MDLAEEKIYDLDVKKKTYTVTTFAESKKRIEAQRAKAEKEAAEARKEAEKQQSDEQAPAKEFEVEFEMKEPGQTRAIAGHEARQVTRIRSPGTETAYPRDPSRRCPLGMTGLS